MMRIGLVQDCFEEASGDGTFACYARYAAQAAEQGCQALLFPELSDTGYVLDRVHQRAGCWPGPAFEAARQAAAQYGLILFCGLSERVGDLVYNSAAVFDTEGALCGHYRKTHLFCGPEGAESDVFATGDTLVLVEAGGVRWGLSICFDLRYPELYRALALAGAEVLVNLAAWPALRIQDWSTLARARALENQVYLAAVNHTGGRFGGCSGVVDPSGAMLVEGSGVFAGLLTCEIDLSRMATVREALPVITARRPATYAPARVRVMKRDALGKW